MSSFPSLRTLLVLGAVGAAVFALHCSSDDDNGSTASSCAFTDADPTSVRRLTAEQQALVTRASDRAKAALSPVEWRYLFKLRYAFFPRAVVETDPVVVKALTAIAQDAPSCATTGPKAAEACERFVNVGRCWAGSPIAEATVPCFTWPMMVAGGAACGVPTSPAANHVDAQAWEDSQDGRETDTCGAPCIAGGGCASGTCKCSGDEAPCPGGCARTKTDVVNCGACGRACAAGVSCVEGVCGGTADAGSTDAGDADASDGG
jgi:hypothetical protein